MKIPEAKEDATMGGSSWSDATYSSRARARRATGASAFAYNDKMREAPEEERTVHPQMNPYGVTRESRDSAAHPNSLAVMVFIDETGSMADTPRVFQRGLPRLMGRMISGGVADPQVFFGAIGDEPNGERAPLQTGQFESGIETEDDLGKIYMEGLGGGTQRESYELGIYFAARRTSIDCYEKRGKKGYLFLVGDEMPYEQVRARAVKRLIGDSLEANIPIVDIIAEASKKYHIFFVMPNQTNNYKDPEILGCWRKLLGGENVVLLDDPEKLSELIADTVIAREANKGSVSADSKKKKEEKPKKSGGDKKDWAL